jgi:hypothetical protein
MVTWKRKEREWVAGGDVPLVEQQGSRKKEEKNGDDRTVVLKKKERVAMTSDGLNIGSGLAEAEIQPSPTAMIILSWNCRGLGNLRTVHYLSRMVREKKPEVVFLMETIMRRRKMENV